MQLFMVKTMKLNSLALISGEDIYFENQFKVHSPTILELGQNNISEDTFLQALKLLIIDKNECDGDNLDNIDNFHLLLGVIFNEKMPNEHREGFFKVFKLLLKDYEISVSELGFILNDKIQEDNFYSLNAKNFELFQKYIKQIFCLDKIFSSQQEDEYNAQGTRAKKIAEQLKKRHATLSEKNKGQQTKDNISIFSNYLTILAVGVPCDINKLKELTIYQLYNLLDRYSLYYNYDLDVRCKLAGSTEQTEVENWMKIH